MAGRGAASGSGSGSDDGSGVADDSTVEDDDELDVVVGAAFSYISSSMPLAIRFAILRDDCEPPPHVSALFPGHGMSQIPPTLVPPEASKEVAQ